MRSAENYQYIKHAPPPSFSGACAYFLLAVLLLSFPSPRTARMAETHVCTTDGGGARQAAGQAGRAGAYIKNNEPDAPGFPIMCRGLQCSAVQCSAVQPQRKHQQHQQHQKEICQQELTSRPCLPSREDTDGGCYLSPAHPPERKRR